MEKMIIGMLLLLFGNARLERTFPKEFSFGTGTSAYQTEGAWNEDGKSENIWDHWIHEDPSHIKNNDTADDAANSYMELGDLAEVVQLGVQHYRFSVAWSRILPSGYNDTINIKAIMYYQKMLGILKHSNITAVVTLYYHDLPQSLQDIGGWTNPDMANYFADYARICFQYLSDVDYWITFNDPRTTCINGYGDGTFAPGVKSDGIGDYMCAYTIVKAHAAAYHVYKEEFKHLNGKISIAIDMKYSVPATISNDTGAVARRNAFEFGLYANPIYKGNWPKEVIERVDYRSKGENRTNSRLPKFTDDEIKYINGTSDFMAVNLYYTNIVEEAEEAEFGDPSYTKDMKAKVYMDPSWTLAENGQPIVPENALYALIDLKIFYNNPEIFITENGIPDNDTYRDYNRIDYYMAYLSAILDAIEENGVKVIGYTAWSLIDSFEWTNGYSYKFGFYYVKYESPLKPRFPKQSAQFYTLLAQTFTLSEKTTTTSTTRGTTPSTTTPGSATKMSCSVMLFITSLLQYYVK